MRRLDTFLQVSVVVALSACSVLSPEPTPTPTLTDTPAPTLTPTPDGQQLQLGWEAIEGEDPETAAEIARTILDQDPQAAQAYSLLAAALVLQRQPEEAITHLEQAQDLGLEDADTLSWLGRAYLLQIHNSWDADLVLQRIQDLKTLLYQLEEDNPEHEFVTANRRYFRFRHTDIQDMENLDQDYVESFADSIIALEREEYETAIRNLELIVEQCPDFILGKAILGSAYYFADDYTRSIELLQEVLQSRGNDSYIWIMLGNVYAYISLPVHAKNAFIEALILDVENASARQGLRSITAIYQDWQTTPEENFGFEFRTPPLTIFDMEEQAADNTSDLGVVVFTPSWATLIAFAWTIPDVGTEMATDDLEVVSEEMLDWFINDQPNISQLNMDLPQGYFPYNSVEMYYRCYQMVDSRDGTPFTKCLYVWRCSDRLFFVHTETLSDELYDSFLDVNPILESFQCERSDD